MTQRDNQQRRNTRQRMRRRSEVTKTKKTQAGFERRLRQNRSEVYIPPDVEPEHSDLTGTPDIKIDLLRSSAISENVPDLS